MRFTVPLNAKVEAAGASWIRVEDAELPHPLLVRLGIDDDGRLVATGLLIEAAGELTTRDLRLPLARIVSEFAAAASRPATFKRLFYAEMLGRPEALADKDLQAWLESADADTLAGLAPSLVGTNERREPIPSRPGRRGHTDEHYRTVAKAYRRAQRQHPRAPIRALMDELHASEPTIHRWLRTAREKGFLKEEK